MSYEIKQDGKFKYIEEGQGETLMLLHGLFGADLVIIVGEEAIQCCLDQAAAKGGVSVGCFHDRLDWF